MLDYTDHLFTAATFTFYSMHIYMPSQTEDNSIWTLAVSPHPSESLNSEP